MGKIMLYAIYNYEVYILIILKYIIFSWQSLSIFLL